MEPTRKYHGSRFGAVLVTAMAVLTSAVVAMCTGQETESSARASFEGLQSDSERTRDAAVDAILAERKATIERLIPLIDPANAERHRKETRWAAAFLLGEMRAVEAVPVLAKALDRSMGPQNGLDLSPYDEPVFNALVRIGRPAVPALLENLRKSDDRILRERSLLVLYHILGGNRRVVEALAATIEADAGGDRDASRRLREAHAQAERSRQEAIERGDKESPY
ncbi:MAG TPA: hypothetical protein VGN57_13350 [Pirellulaceae bacterium]|jgi:HEAT repeat protein|nr:hypothetical protein [Pirellulaceae bacterium]